MVLAKEVPRVAEATRRTYENLEDRADVHDRRPLLGLNTTEGDLRPLQLEESTPGRSRPCESLSGSLVLDREGAIAEGSP